MKKATLYIVGTPLSESFPLSPQIKETLNDCKVIIGESKPVLDRYLKGSSITATRFHLDPPRRDEQELLFSTLLHLSKDGGIAALLSDVGMPILFDPGSEILEYCRKLGFQIRTVPGPTSWSTACSLSGWKPPFLIYGFLDRDPQMRIKELKTLTQQNAHIVLMETPYRFRKLLSTLDEALDPKRQVFLAWEISKEQETYTWGTLEEILRYAETSNLQKGEFVLLLKGKSRVR